MANEIDINIGTYDLDSTNGVSVDDIGININKTVVEFALPKYHGSIIPIGKRKSMTLRVRGSVVSTNYDALRTLLDNLKNAFDDTAEKKFTIDDDRCIFVQYKAFSYSWKMLRTFANFSVELVASDPFVYSSTLNSDSRTPTTGVSYNITNAGNAPTRVKVTVTAGGAAISDDLKIQNLTAGETMQYRGSIASGDELVVNNRVDDPDLEVTNDGTSDFPNFEGDFLTLLPGVNAIQVDCASMGTVELEWRDCYK